MYDPDEIRIAADWPGISRIQAPANALNFSAIEARGTGSIALDLRSIFVQGALLDSVEVAERRVPGIGPTVRAVEEAASASGNSVATALASSVLSNTRQTDRIVIGVDSESQIEPVVAALNVAAPAAALFAQRLKQLLPADFRTELIDPRCWNAT